MEIVKTNISPCLHSVQMYRTQGMFTTIDESVSRIRNTREKINYLLHKIHMLELQWGPITSYEERISDMVAIRNAIGVYGIYDPTDLRRVRGNTLWYREGIVSEESDEYKRGTEWWDYFGDPYLITDIGGYVIVSLSDIGISYLNDISKGISSLSSLSSSYTTT
jgi:hypothetical protein